MMPPSARFAIYIYDDVEPIDLGATFGTLSMAKRICSDIEIYVVAKEAGLVELTNGLVVKADYGVDDCPPADYLILSGGPGWSAQCQIPEVLEFINRAAKSSAIASVCTGTMILAETGLLDGLKATTKKNVAKGETSPIISLANTHPDIDVVDALVVDNGKIVTGGGVTLAIDTVLHLLARHLGKHVAEETARIMEYDISWKMNREMRQSYNTENAVID